MAHASVDEAQKDQVIALAMYDLPEVRWATDALFSALYAALKTQGFDSLAPTLDRDANYLSQWTEPRLLLAQTCGYPLKTMLKDRVQYVATPSYLCQGAAEGGHFSSALVVRASSTFSHISDLAHATVAYNRTYSQSGFNALRYFVATETTTPRPFFSKALELGGHATALKAVQSGEADCAAIDCVTLALLRTHRPSALEGVRVLAYTEHTPGLPFITRSSLTASELDKVRSALRQVFTDTTPSLQQARAALLLTGELCECEDDYEQLLDMERVAQLQEKERGAPILFTS